MRDTQENWVTEMAQFSFVQFSHSVMSDSVTPWTPVHQASLSITNSWSLLKLMSSARSGSTYTKIGMIQRRLARPLSKDDTQIYEAFHIFGSGGEGGGRGDRAGEYM